MIDLLTFARQLRAAHCRATSELEHLWTPDSPSTGQCHVSSILLNREFGGQILRGRVMSSKPFPAEQSEDLQRLLSRVARDVSCWLWTGPLDRKGYGSLRLHGRASRVHRIAYQLMVGPIPDGLEVDHRCHVRNCVNPEHLQAVPHQLNTQNRAGARIDARSGARGVNWHAANKKWVVRVCVDGVDHYGGSFVDLAEASARALELRHRLMVNNIADRWDVEFPQTLHYWCVISGLTVDITADQFPYPYSLAYTEDATDEVPNETTMEKARMLAWLAGLENAA